MKRCSGCHKQLPRDAFTRDESHGDGLASRCRECRRRQRRLRREDREKALARTRRFNEANRERLNAEKLARQKANPLQHRAHQVVYRALRNGALIRPERCQGCNVAVRRLHAHHADYQKPLDIRWLCGSCHGAEHSMVAA